MLTWREHIAPRLLQPASRRPGLVRSAGAPVGEPSRSSWRVAHGRIADENHVSWRRGRYRTAASCCREERSGRVGSRSTARRRRLGRHPKTPPQALSPPLARLLRGGAAPCHARRGRCQLARRSRERAARHRPAGRRPSCQPQHASWLACQPDTRARVVAAPPTHAPPQTRWRLCSAGSSRCPLTIASQRYLGNLVTRVSRG